MTRRNGENLLLKTEHEADECCDIFAIAVQIIIATILEGGSLADLMAAVFPWIVAHNSEKSKLS